MAYFYQVTIDAKDPHGLADWWAAALGWEVEETDESFIRQMIAEGFAIERDTTIHRGRLVWAGGAAIVHPEGVGRAPRTLFQLVPEAKSVKNRVHLDLRIGDDGLESTVARLTAAGASVLHQSSQGRHVWYTLADPEGNEFCVSP